MSTGQIIIVTGARILADDPAATRWAREILSRELASASLVVAGDARGPDQWAHEIAQGMVAPIDCERWMVAGHVERWAALPGRRGGWSFAGRWDGGGVSIDPKRRPLERNVEMIAAYDIGPGGPNVRLVALHHADATTRGTAHTVGLARAAGIEVTEYVWRAL